MLALGFNRNCGGLSGNLGVQARTKFRISSLKNVSAFSVKEDNYNTNYDKLNFLVIVVVIFGNFYAMYFAMQ